MAAGLRGDQPDIEIEEVLGVGFDVGWTSRGLRASRIFPVPSPLEGETRQEGDVASDESSGEDEYQLDIK